MRDLSRTRQMISIKIIKKSRNGLDTSCLKSESKIADYNDIAMISKYY